MTLVKGGDMTELGYSIENWSAPLMLMLVAPTIQEKARWDFMMKVPV